MAYSFDTTLGIATAIGLHKLAVRLCQQRLAAAGLPDGREVWYRAIAECGNYGALALHASRRLPEESWQRRLWRRQCSSRQRLEVSWHDAGVPPRWQRFALQLLEWTCAVLLARVICGSVVS